MLPKTRYHLFVYGTLRPGGRYHRKLCQKVSPRSCPAFVRGRLFHLNAGYPGLASGDEWVRGEVLSFDDPELRRAIDVLEEYDPKGPPEANVYLRTPIDAYTADGELLGTVETYRMPMDTIQRMKGKLVAGGDWNAWMASGMP